MTTLPFLTAYDPPASSEGQLDPLGLYVIADRLATQLVPGVRERMQRIRFLTAIAVGCLVTDGIDDQSPISGAPSYLVWEWLLAEAFQRTRNGSELWGVPGTLVAARAMEQHGYLDSRSYLKNARIFGFHGVYKRLAHHLGVVDVNLGPAVLAEELVEKWAKALGATRSKDHIGKWAAAVRSSLSAKPQARTSTNFKAKDWETLAAAFHPDQCSGPEREFLRNLLLAADDRMGALPTIWQLQPGFKKENYSEEELHARLLDQAPHFRPLLNAIKAYEGFARRLQDAFDLLRAEASKSDCIAFEIAEIAKDPDFIISVSQLHQKFDAAHKALSDVNGQGASLQFQFADRFSRFAEPLSAETCAIQICEHHAWIQSNKSEEGKLTWFERLDSNRIYMRQPYRIKRRELKPEQYVHDYRGRPIRNFWGDLA